MPRKSWWARLPFSVRITAGTSAVLLVLAAAVAGIATLTRDRPAAPRIVTAIGQAAPQAGDEIPAPPPLVPATPGLDPATGFSRTTDQADRTGGRQPRPPAGAPAQAHAQPAVPGQAQHPVPGQAKPPVPGHAPPVPAKAQAPHRAATTTTGKAPTRTPAKPPAAPDSRTPVAAGPVITTRTDVETREVPFQTRFVRDPFLPRGARKITAAGVPGEQTLRYLVTLTDGRETGRKLLGTTVTRDPQQRVITFGTARDFDDDLDDDGGHRDRCGHRLRFCVPMGRQTRSYCPDDRDELTIDLPGLDVLDGNLTRDVLRGELPQDVLDGELPLTGQGDDELPLAGRGDDELPLAGRVDGELPQMDCAAEPEISKLRR
ncbi:G5 domain-containing protein [Actinoplanes sp. Pm04-4]|uniref:G5 domain-containing protein n=1 Tax=Paractinoplanes pyxinae TaxID=2997416 RepID=A0ABT4B2L7_9ACTN|nr:G5 domain-containing protein [Actinoplanes pyxinae]MCY1140738.1 G5 domain-containing protein [Actinoplanes pyxinae]